MHDYGLRRMLMLALPKPKLRHGATGAPRKPIRLIILVGRHPNPTSDYYFAARLTAPGMPPHQMVDISSKDFSNFDADGAFIILCRYTSPAVLRWIEQESSKLAGVGLFLDDDIPAVILGREASIAYRMSLFFLGLMPLRRLNRHLDVVWASTPRLAERLKSAQARVLPPAPPESLWNIPHETASGKREELLIAYHATSIHVDEHRFLQPIIKEILAARPQTRFEVFVGKASVHIWHDMERVTLRQQASWSDYLAEALTRRIDIMLVPLAPSPINDCRSSTKRIDVARVGAAGVFSISQAYGSPDDSGEIRLPEDQKLWRDAILTLIDSPLKRQVAVQATRNFASEMTSQARAGLDFIST